MDCKGSSPLLKYAKNNTSQGGEDGILEYIFSLLEVYSLKEKRMCVEVGAWDGKHLSNTYTLIHDCNWGGVLFEANELRAAEMQFMYRDRDDVVCSSTAVSLVGNNSLSNLLQNHGVAYDFDFISIDIDGADYFIWKSLHACQYRPRVVCIEFNPTIPNHVFFVQEEDVRIQQGSSLLALKELGRECGYTLVVTTTFNGIFVRNDLMSCFPAGWFDATVDYPLYRYHTSTMGTDMFQTYDGELKFVGPKKLIWHKLALNPQNMQVLSNKKLRKFPYSPPWKDSLHALHAAMAVSMEMHKKYVFLPPDSSAPTDVVAQLNVDIREHFRPKIIEIWELVLSMLPITHLQGIMQDTISTIVRQVDCVRNVSMDLMDLSELGAMQQYVLSVIADATCLLEYRGDLLTYSSVSAEVRPPVLLLSKACGAKVTEDRSMPVSKLSALENNQVDDSTVEWYLQAFYAVDQALCCCGENVPLVDKLLTARQRLCLKLCKYNRGKRNLMACKHWLRLHGHGDSDCLTTPQGEDLALERSKVFNMSKKLGFQNPVELG